MTDVMLDIETFSTKPNAVILTIGAIKFDRDVDSVPSVEKMDTFYRRITVESNLEKNRHICPRTKQWWSQQTDEARFEIEDPKNRVGLKIALEDFKEWFGKSTYVWSHGDDFDTVIVGDAMCQYDIETPWKFYNTRDTRTLFDLADIKPWDLPKVNKHHALYDCHNQIAGVIAGLKKLY